MKERIVQLAGAHRAPPMQKSTKSKSTVARKVLPPVRHSRRSFERQLAELRRRLAEIADLRAAGALLSWDQATYMPPGGAAARGRQRALLRTLAHRRSVD